MTQSIRKVLIIEDDRLQAAQFRRTLEKAGFEVQMIDYASGAMDMIDVEQPDLIVADMLLAGSTLIPLLNELQSHTDLATIPVVVVSSIADQMRLEDLAPYGVKAMLDKTTMHPDDVASEAKRLLL